MKYTGINFFLPTFQRLDGLKRFIDSCESLALYPMNNRYTLLVNDKDDATLRYAWNLENADKRFAVLYECDSGPDLAKFYNRIYDFTPFDEEELLVTMVSDDMEFQTVDFDDVILHVANKTNGVVVIYCNDGGAQGEKLCVNLITSRKVVDASGAPFMCPKFRANFIDTVWMQVGQALDILHYLSDVVLQHHHQSKLPGSQRDETHLRLQRAALPFPIGYREVDKAAKPIIDAIRRSGIL